MLVSVILFMITLSSALGQTNVYDITDPSTWQFPEWGGRPPGELIDDGGFVLRLPKGRSWAAITKNMVLDVDKYPVLAVRVSSLSPGASWVLKVDNQVYDPSNPHDIQPVPAGGDKPGVYMVDLRALGGWQGSQQIELRLFVTGTDGSRVAFSKIAMLGTGTGSVFGFSDSADNREAVTLTAKPFVMLYDLGKAQLTVCKPGAPGAVVASLPVGTEIVSQEMQQEGGVTTATIRTKSDWGVFDTRLTAYKQTPGLFRWSIDADLTKPHTFASASPECTYAISPFAPREISVNREYAVNSLTLRPRVEQKGVENGNVYCVYDPALGASCLYFEDFSTLNAYFEATRTTASQTVKAGSVTFGYAMPGNPNITIPAGTHLRLVDSYLYLNDSVLPSVQQSTDRLEECRVYTELMSTIYDVLPKPATVYTDWKKTADKLLADLDRPDCWCNPEKGMLRNYVAEPWGPDGGELTVQLDPYMTALAYEHKWGVSTNITRRIAPTIPLFYSAKTGLVRDYCTDEDPKRWDTGWILYLPVVLARSAEMGAPEARKLLKDTLPKIIELGRKCSYNFPMFMNPVNLDHFEYSIPDSVGTYAYLMLQAYSLFGDGVYLDEARNALKHVREHGLDLSYEMHYTACTAAACARMWKITGDASYLKLSYVPVANLILHSRLWDCKYGLNKDHNLFFGIACMPSAYIAPYETYHTWLLLREYDGIAHDVLPASIRKLISEYIRYTPTVLRYTLPPYMSPGSVMQVNERGHRNDLSLFIPVEDLNDGWVQSGKLGQEIYGCGAPLSIAAEAYTRIPEAGISIYTEYPLKEAKWNPADHSLRLSLLGVPEYKSLVAIRYSGTKCSWPASGKLTVQGAAVSDRVNEDGQIRFRIPGESNVLIHPD